MSKEQVNHPEHYGKHPSGVECIDVVEHMSFNLGNALKYIWRADLKGNTLQDLKKALWYIERELSRKEGGYEVVEVGKIYRGRFKTRNVAREVQSIYKDTIYFIDTNYSPEHRLLEKCSNKKFLQWAAKYVTPDSTPIQQSDTYA